LKHLKRIGKVSSNSNAQKIIISVGEVLWDILPKETILGGATCNFIYRINSLGDKGYMVSRIGKEEMGKKAFDRVSAMGIDTKYFQLDEKYPTGAVQVMFDKDNNPDYVIIPDVAYDYIEINDSLLQLVSGSDCLYFGTLAQRSEKARKTIVQLLEVTDNLKLLDINLRKKCYNLDTVEYSLKKADILKLNEDEASKLFEMLSFSYNTIPEFCEKIMEKYHIKYCIVTLANKGAFACSEKEKVYDPGYKIDLVDSLGAGDAFSAAFVHCILRDLSLAEACKLGNILGALVCTTKAATQPITNSDIVRFKNSKTERIYYKDFK
jgi:fructokinase